MVLSLVSSASTPLQPLLPVCHSPTLFSHHLWIRPGHTDSPVLETSLPTRSGQTRTMASGLEALILIPAASLPLAKSCKLLKWELCMMRPSGQHRPHTAGMGSSAHGSGPHSLEFCPYNLWTELVAKGIPGGGRRQPGTSEPLPSMRTTLTLHHLLIVLMVIYRSVNVHSGGSDRRPVCYLHSGLSQLGPLCQFFAGVDVRVVCSLKHLLQLLQLFCCERGATPALLPFQGEIRLRFHVRCFIHASAWAKQVE